MNGNVIKIFNQTIQFTVLNFEHQTITKLHEIHYLSCVNEITVDQSSEPINLVID